MLAGHLLFFFCSFIRFLLIMDWGIALSWPHILFCLTTAPHQKKNELWKPSSCAFLTFPMGKTITLQDKLKIYKCDRKTNNVVIELNGLFLPFLISQIKLEKKRRKKIETSEFDAIFIVGHWRSKWKLKGRVSMSIAWIIPFQKLSENELLLLPQYLRRANERTKKKKNKQYLSLEYFDFQMSFFHPSKWMKKKENKNTGMNTNSNTPKM